MDQGLAALVGAVVGAVSGVGGGIAGARLNVGHERRMWLRDKQAERLEIFNNALVAASSYAGWFDYVTPRFELTESHRAQLAEVTSTLIASAQGLLLYSSNEVVDTALKASRVFEEGVRSTGDHQVESIRQFRDLAETATGLVRKELGI